MREKVREERGADMGEKGLSRACELAREVEIDKGEDEEDGIGDLFLGMGEGD